MNRSIRILLASTTIVFTAACQKDDRPIKTTSTGEVNVSTSGDSAEARGHSLVRIVNAVNGGKDAVVQLGDQTIFEGVKAASVTDYREISSKPVNFAVRTAGATEGVMLAEKDQILMDGDRYTVFLVSDDVSKNTLRIVKDDVAPDSGKARIRVFHAAPGGPELDVSVAGSKDKLFSGVNFKTEAGYQDVDPANVTLEVRAKDESKVLLRVRDVSLKAGTATTIVFTGATKLTAFKFTDSLMAAPKK